MRGVSNKHCLLTFFIETPVSERPMGLYNRKKELVRARSDSKEEFRNVPRMSQVRLRLSPVEGPFVFLPLIFQNP